MKYKVFVKKIEWLSEEIKEGDVTFEINGNEYVAFCHPCELVENEYNIVEFDFLDIDNMTFEQMFSGNYDKSKRLIQDAFDSSRYKAFAQVVSVDPVVVDVGDFHLEFAYYKDPRLVGEYLVFDILRLDIWKADSED